MCSGDDDGIGLERAIRRNGQQQRAGRRGGVGIGWDVGAPVCSRGAASLRPYYAIFRIRISMSFSSRNRSDNGSRLERSKWYG
jgi:hypothetical protein